MSDAGINWYTLIYPAVAIPILILAVIRWNILRKRQLQRAQQMSQNYNNGFAAQDFVAGNPFDAANQTASVYNIEQQSSTTENPQYPYGTQHQTTTKATSSDDPPPPYYEATRKKKQETPVDEPPSMIQSRRWF